MRMTSLNASEDAPCTSGSVPGELPLKGRSFDNSSRSLSKGGDFFLNHNLVKVEANENRTSEDSAVAPVVTVSISATLTEMPAKALESEKLFSGAPRDGRTELSEVLEKPVDIKSTGERDRPSRRITAIALPLSQASEAEAPMPTSTVSLDFRQAEGNIPNLVPNHEGASVPQTIGTLAGVDSNIARQEAKGKSVEDDYDSEEDESSGSETDASREESDEEDADDSSSSLAEVSLKDEDVQELVDELYRIESEAAEAQEMLEEESLVQVKEDVQLELGAGLSGLELDAAVKEEVSEFVSQWEEEYEKLQEQSSLLQEKLEDAGVSLPDLFKEIEKQAPDGCTTEAWKERTHWAGHQPSQEIELLVKRASEKLKIQNPPRSQHGKLSDAGASGFLKRKLAAWAEDNGPAEASTHESPNDIDWSAVDEFLEDEEISDPGQLMGTKRWAAVYMASTPEQAVQLGLAVPGIDTVEEIGDIGSDRRFKVAFANEKERGLTETQKKSIKKVREEDDVKQSRRMQRRPKKRSSQPAQGKPSQQVQESHAYLSELRDKRQQAMIVQQGLIVRTNGDAEQYLDESAAVIGLLSNDERAHGSISGKAEATSEWQKQDVSRGESQLQLLQVKAEERQESNNGILTDPGIRPEPPDALEAVPAKGIMPPKQQLDSLKRKFPYEEPRASNGDPENSPKRPKLLTFGGEVGRPDGEETIQMQEFPSSDDPVEVARQSESQDAITVYRTTVVIDSDGEREVEEAVVRNANLSRLPPVSPFPVNVQRLVEGMANTASAQIGMKHMKHSLSNTRENRSPSTNAEASVDIRKRKWKSPEKERRDFPCTACGMLLRKSEVLRHPKLPVGICRKCKKHYLSGPFLKDEDGSDSECSWCGEGGKVVCCDQCDKVFCEACITRNFGAGESLRVVSCNDWLCYFCYPLPLSIFSDQLKQAESETKGTFDDRSEFGACVKNKMATDDLEPVAKKPKSGKHRKNIRKVLGDDELEEKQRELIEREQERKKRLELWQLTTGLKSSSSLIPRKKVSTSILEMNIDEPTLINFPRSKDEEEVRIAPSLARVMKSHQVRGVRFMWENCIVSEQKVREGGEGVGCILAHSMGLGKTLQVITFLHTVLNRNLGLRTALIVVPVNVLHNWRREFEIWQRDVANPVSVHLIEDSIRENTLRASILSQWQENGGVMLIGYAAFRNLSLGNHVKEKDIRDELCRALQNPGPDVLVCDEAHMIKNGKADITLVLKQVKTHRRIALTGTPLQNNLMEYYCMVDFVREGFLGTQQVFKNRFHNPMANGQHADSTKSDVRLMKQRAHVLYKQLEGFVQRRNTSVLKEELPPKCIYVISVRLSPLQRQLYRLYLKVYGLLEGKDEVVENRTQKRLFHAYHAFARIWNHPDLLLVAEEERGKKPDETVENLIVDSEDEKLSDSELDVKTKLPSSLRQLKKKGSGELEEIEGSLWWKDIITDDYERGVLVNSGKMVLLLRLLTMCSRKGDKALVFSQSLGTLSVIEQYLQRVLEANGTYWHRDKNWYRLDGSTAPATRMHLCERFNDPSNKAVKCFLISTRAGSLGINLPAANRVIIVDGSWNPAHDMQAIYRAWRIGQTKPVYAYRLLAHGTMEEKIYSRQVAKEGVAARVLDEQQVLRHFEMNDLENLFSLDDDGDDFDSKPSNEVIQNTTSLDPSTIGALTASVSLPSTSRSKLMTFTVPADAPPRDELLGKLLLDYRPRWVVGYHEHEPLLEHIEEETLTSEEREAAWITFGDRMQNSLQTVPAQPSSNAQVALGVAAPSPAAGQKRCERKELAAREHGPILLQRKVEVGQEIECPNCMRFISWENLTGVKRV